MDIEKHLEKCEYSDEANEIEEDISRILAERRDSN